MKQILFEIPIWKTDIDPKKLILTSSGFQKTFVSESLSSLHGTNKMEIKGYNYIVKKITDCLSSDYKVKTILNFDCWRNIYDNHYQERHNHCSYQFSFLIYEKIKKPQTIFLHPSKDLMDASNASMFFKYSYLLEPEENKLIIFPGYLDHMVKLSKDSQTISGNFNVKLEGTNGS